jgi:hypothetical protein
LLQEIDVPSLLKDLDPKAGDKLRRVLVRDLVDFLILHKEKWPKALRLLGENKAADQRYGGRARRANGEGSIRPSFTPRAPRANGPRAWVACPELVPTLREPFPRSV